jgi:heme/copper-type cytochrome/quinol oxidase subunit 3
MNTARIRLSDLPVDEAGGTWGMWLFIVTEGVLFLMLFLSWLYLGNAAPVSPPARPDPGPALGMLVLFVVGTAALHRAAAMLRAGQWRGAAVGVLGGLALGAVFLVLEVLELRKHAALVSPRDEALGSVVLGINGLHALHVFAGLLMVAYVALLLPGVGAAGRPLHRPLRNVILYWDFLAVVWAAAFLLLYVVPRLPGGGP